METGFFYSFLGQDGAIPISSDTKCVEAFSIGAGLLKLSIEAINAFEKSSLSQLDPLVSDTACQVRAVAVALIYQRYQTDPVFQNALHATKKKCNEIKLSLHLKTTQAASKMSAVCSQALNKTIDFVLSNEIRECAISPEVIFLTQAYLLTKIKHVEAVRKCCSCCGTEQEGFNEITKEQKVSGYFKRVSSEMVQQIITKSKQCIAAQALQILRSQVQHSAMDIVIFDRSIKVVRDRAVLACFYTMQCMLEVAGRDNVPLVLKVKKELHPVEKSPHDPFDVTLCYDMRTRQWIDLNILADTCPLFVIEATRSGPLVQSETPDQYVLRLKQYDLPTIILLHAAQHSQYPDSSEIVDPAENGAIKTLAHCAQETGCSFDNRQLLFNVHIFPSTVREQK